MNRPIQTLLFTTLYPSSVRPTHGIFVETRLRELLKTGGVKTRVVAPVPWFPSTNPRFGAWSKMAATPRYERWNGIEVWHPRYLLPPKVGMLLAPFTMALGALGLIREIQKNGYEIDLIDAHYYYPDGVAAALLSAFTGLPFVVTARGTDLNLLPRYLVPRALIRWTAGKAAASIAVSNALMQVLIELGIDRSKLRVFRNGVDLERFSPQDGQACRRSLALEPNQLLLLSVGHLVVHKGHDIAIKALPHMRALGFKVHLAVIGGGPALRSLMTLAEDIGVQAHVTFLGPIDNTELASWYSAADYLVLASSREGWANVLLESLACGTPVLASKVGGTPEVITQSVAGELFDPRTPDALTTALERAVMNRRLRSDVRNYAAGFSWEETSQNQKRLFDRVLAEGKGTS